MSAYATNAASTSYAAYPGSRLSSHQAQGPDGKTLIEGYRKDIIAGFEKDPPRFNPMNPERTQSSALVDLKDPIQVHLLTETALSDSKEYEILSQEEVDDLKKQIQSLGQRIDSTRNNLLIQSKYRDAANSMARLYSPGRPEGRRRSILGRNSGSGGDIVKAKEAEVERQASERKCEELASELFNLEKRFMEPQRRLLEHTAGILQLTHKVSKKKNIAPSLGQPINGMPGSPESLYTYTRNSMDQAAEGNYFDESPYEFDQLDGLQTSQQPRANHIEIPLKSPNREQNSQLRDDLDRTKEENEQLRKQTDVLIRSISEMEVRFENLNGSLRDAIVRFNPPKNDHYIEPPFGTPSMEPGEVLRNQLDYLETGIFAIQAEQEEYSGGEKMSQRIESLNQHIREILLSVDPDHPPAPHPSQTDVDGQVSYLEDSMRAVDSELERALNNAKMGSLGKQDNDQVEAVLVGLWEIIQSGFAKVKQQKDERRRARLEKGLEDDEGSDDEFDTDEPYTLSGFSAKVQWLYSQATTLKHQKSVLKRQIKQQRELNNKSDAEKDEEIARKQEEVEESRILVARAEKDAMDAQTMLSEALEDLEKARDAANNTYVAHAVTGTRDREVQERDAHIKQRDAQLQEREAELEEIEAELQEHKSLLNEHRTQLRQHKATLEERDMQLEDHVAQSEHHSAQMQERNARVATLESDLQELQAHIHSANSTSQSSQSRLAEVEHTIATLSEQLAVATQSQAASEESAQSLKKQFEAQKEDLEEKGKMLKIKEDELEMLNMNLAEVKTELTIAQAELEGAYGSRAERAADIAALKTGAEVTKLQNQITKLKSELSGTVQELEDVTKESLGAEREKIELENKLDDAEALKNTLEGEISGLRDRLEEEMDKARDRLEEETDKARDRIAQLQDELDGERLKAVPGQGGAGRAGTGASIISERFRTTMREERKKFQEELKEERARARKLEEELARLKRGPGSGSLSPKER